MASISVVDPDLRQEDNEVSVIKTPPLNITTVSLNSFQGPFFPFPKPQMQKTRRISATGFSNLMPGNVLLSHGNCHTIIDAVSFHF